MKHLLVAISLALTLCGCARGDRYGTLREELAGFVAGKDASIGIAVIVDGCDTVAVNGYAPFPMLSVYKFPIALALADTDRAAGLDWEHGVDVLPEDLRADTYSPMTKIILASSALRVGPLELPASEILAYMLRQSDNNASDIALREVGGASRVADYLARIGARGIQVLSTEAEMHADTALCRANTSTPAAMAALMDRFDRDCTDTLALGIKRIMETCATGTGRLSAPLRGTGAVVGHKTGTGFTTAGGGLMAVNDAGYVRLPSGRRYAIAVFVADSRYGMAATEALVAEISRIVYSALAGEGGEVPRGDCDAVKTQ